MAYLVGTSVYRMEQNGTDSSKNAANANVTNGTYKQGKEGGYAYDCSPSGSIFNCGISIANETNNFGDVSLFCLVKLNATNQDAAIWGAFATNFWTSYGRGMKITSGSLHAMGESNNSKNTISTAFNTAGKWYSISMTASSSGSLWVDGNRKATGDISGGWPYSLVAGQTQDGNGGKRLNGSVDFGIASKEAWSVAKHKNYHCYVHGLI